MELISPLSDLPREDEAPRIKAFSNKQTLQSYEPLEEKQSLKIKVSTKPFHLRKVSKEPQKSRGALVLQDDNISEELEQLETTHTKDNNVEEQKQPPINDQVGKKPATQYKPVFAKPALNKKPFGKPQMKANIKPPIQHPRQSSQLLPRRSLKHKQQDEEIPFSQQFGIQADQPKVNKEPVRSLIPAEIIRKHEEEKIIQKAEMKRQQEVQKELKKAEQERVQEIKTVDEKQFWGENGGEEAEAIDFDDLQF